MYFCNLKKEWCTNSKSCSKLISNEIDMEQFYKDKEMIINIDDKNNFSKRICFLIENYINVKRLKGNDDYKFLDDFVNIIKYLKSKIYDIFNYYGINAIVNDIIYDNDTYTVDLKVFSNENLQLLMEEDRIKEAVSQIIFLDDSDKFSISSEYDNFNIKYIYKRKN